MASINGDIRVRSRSNGRFIVGIVMAGFVAMALAFSLSFLPSVASAATSLFSNGFESPAGFSVWTSVNNDWSIISDNHSGSKAAEVKDANGDELRKNVSTAGYGTITLSYWYKIPGGLSNDDHVKVQWSTDGTTWNTITDYAGSPTVSNWVSATHVLPVGAANNSNFRFRFYAYDLGQNDKFRLDDVVLSGTVLDTTAPVVTINPALQTVEATGPTGASASYTKSATDNVDGNISGSVVCTPASGSTFALGTTTITCSVSDAAGNVGSTTAKVVVVDTTGPEITLNGSAHIHLNVGDTFVDQGATATDLVDGTVAVVVDGDTVNTMVPGVYHIYYNASDNTGNDAQEVTRTVIISDVTAPVVTITPATQTVEATGSTGATASFAVTAIDDVDGDISGSATCTPTSGSVFALGDTTVTCSATDSSEQEGNGSATVTVVDTTAPVITLVGDASVPVAFGSTYTDAGATATDIVDGTVSVTVGGDTVDTNTPGVYTITYNAVDAHGNHAAEVTRAVVVGAQPVENTQALCTDGIDNDGDEATDLSDSDCAAFVPTEETPTNTNTNTNTGSGSTGGGSGGVVIGSGIYSIGFVNTNPTGGQVLGASTEAPSCGAYLTSYLKKGSKNVEQVKKLQSFLNKHLGLSLEINGIFGQETFDAVMAFQQKYADDILKPWFAKGLSKDMNASGFVYKTTLHKINQIECASLNTPAPQLP